MPYAKLQFKPGINREVTSYTNEGGWYDGDKIRFRFGFPEKIKGWVKQSSNSFLGSCRALLPWVSLDQDRYIGVGTSVKYYVNQGGGYNDITPLRASNLLNRNTSFEVTGVSGTGSVGTVTVLEVDVQESVTGVSATASVGEVYVRVNTDEIVVLGPGLSATGVLGSVTVGGNVYTSISVSVTGVEASGSVAAVTTSQETVNFTDDISFAATNGSSTITATVSSDHGAVAGDFVTFTGALGLGGAITAGVLNQEYQIASVPSSTTFTFVARAANTSISSITVNGQLVFTPLAANALDVGDGGIGIEAFYQISVGLDTSVSGSGWGVGPWSRGAWGSPSNDSVVTNELRLWSHDPYGEDLLMNVRDGGIYYWDASAGLTTRAVVLNSLPGSNAAPTVAKQILVSDRDRHVIAFGCDPEGTPGVQDPMTIRFSSQESLTQWASTATTTAGELRLGSGSEIVCALETRQQILVFTDTTLYAMQYLGPPFTFGVGAISESISIRSPNSAAAVNDMVFWMGRNEFYVYGGTVERLPCTVRDYVFDNFNEGQAEKVVSGVNTTNTEVWWFYPSATSENVDRYVVYNYLEQCWYYGNLGRTAWVDRGVLTNPLAASADGYLYEHEVGFDDGSTSPASAIAAYIDSSPIDIGEGDQFMFIDRMIPDLSFENTASANPSVAFAVSVQNYPFGSYSATTSQNFTRTQVVPVTVATELLFYRLRGRQMSLKVSSSGLDMTWRLGSPRVSMRPDGRR